MKQLAKDENVATALVAKNIYAEGGRKTYPQMHKL